MSSIQGDLSTNLVSVWLTDSSGLTTDLHGSNDLSNGGVTLTTGVQGDAGDFEESGGGDELTISHASQTNLNMGGNDFSIAFWLNLESAPGDKYRFVSKQGPDAGYVVDYTGTNLRFYTGNGSSFNVHQESQTFSNSTDYHVVVTKSGTTSTIYVNGSSLGTGTMASTITDSTTEFIMGNETGGGDAMDGVINQMCVWRGTALSSGNVSTLYNSGSGIPYAAPAASQNSGFLMYM